MLSIFYTVCRQAGENDMTADAMQRLFLNMETLVKEYRESANAELRDLGLRSAEILCLQTLMYHPDGLSVIELAGASERDKAQISRTMKSLNSRGYVQENPADAARQRKIRWQLSDLGQKVTWSMLEKNAGTWEQFRDQLQS